MENTIENKIKFFGQYLGSQIYSEYSEKEMTMKCVSEESVEEDPNAYLLLKPIISITDKDAIEIAKLVHERPKSDKFKIAKKYDKPFGIHVELLDEKINCIYHISINAEGNINANQHFLKTDTDNAISYKHNIGETEYSQRSPIAYIAIVDFLRSKGYAIPWMGLSVAKLVEYGWLKLV